jgi:outer membrane protein assembly factor BamB
VPSIVVDTTGNPVVGGAFLGTIDFGAGPLSSEVMTPSQFVVKFDPAGNPIWSKKLAGYLGAVPLAAGPTGSVIVAPTEASPYVVKLDTSGVELWKRTWSCSSTCSLSGLALAAGDHVVVLGTFEGTTDLGAGTLTSAGREDMFLARLDASGSTLWSESFGADGVDRGGHAAVDFADHIVVTGWTKTGESMGRLDLGGGPLKGADDKNSAFLAKLDYQGGHVWSVRVGDASDLGYLGTPAVDDDNNLVVPAWLNTMDIGCGPSGSGTFVVKFDALGNRVWDARLSDDQSETEAVPFAAVVRAGSPIVAGTLAGDSGFDFGGAASASGLAFVAEYQP